MKKKGNEAFWKFVLKFVNKGSIRRQLYAVYFVAMVLPMVVVGIILITNAKRFLSDYHSDLMQADNDRVKNLMFEFTTQARNLSDNILNDEGVQHLLSGEYESADSFRRAVDKVILLDTYKNTYVGISDITIYCDNPGLVDYKQLVKPKDDITETEWYKKASIQTGVFWTGLTKKNSTGVPSYYLCLVRKLPLMESENNAVLVMWISADYMRSSINTSPYEIFLAVGRENTFYSSNHTLTGKEMPVEIDYEKNYFQDMGQIVRDGKILLMNISTLNTYKADSRIYICLVDKNGYYEIWHILIICYVILAVSIILPGLLILFFTHYLTGRIDLLRSEMHKASREDYELIPVMWGKDEISEAHADLQVMVEKIKEHEAKSYEAQIKEQLIENRQVAMEYKMLASQINPHFLYNTLETIRMKAFTAGDRQVAEAIKLLGKSMRYVLENTGTQETTLAKELEHVEVYLKIQQLRFDDRFDFTINLEEDINPEQIYLLPLLLQPLVENSMVHGLEEMANDGKVKIDVYKKAEDIFIDISDNGGGMDEETLEKLRRDIQIKDTARSKSIGLYNINQRVKLLYGDNYSLFVDSIKGKGTLVRLTIPISQCIHE